MDYLYLGAGLLLLFFGGEGLVRGSVSLARRFGLSPLLVGLVVVGFGTSSPELLVSVQAALRDSPDIAIGNVVGSNIANILLILGAVVLLAPIRHDLRGARRDTVAMGLSALGVLIVALNGTIGRGEGAVLLVMLLGYLAWSYHLDRRTVRAETTDEEDGRLLSLPLALLMTAFGLALLVGGADLLVRGAVSVARDYGLSEAIIGLTLVAVGTSLPELAASMVAALRRQPDVVVGNVVGSCLFNSLGILGVTGIIAPIPVSHAFRALELPIMIAVSAALLSLIVLKVPLGRTVGAVLLVSYGAYIWHLFP